MADSDLGEVLAALDAIPDALAFDGPGNGAPTFGDELLDVYSGHVYERSVGAARAPDGSAWEDNRESTKRRKRTNTVGVESGEMLSLEEIKGERSIGPDEATQVYGKSRAAKAKAEWFSRGSVENPAPVESPGCGHSGASNQPAREFWGLDSQAEDDMADHVRKHLDRAAAEWSR
jgi:hypothetical protein